MQVGDKQYLFASFYLHYTLVLKSLRIATLVRNITRHTSWGTLCAPLRTAM